MIKSIHEALKNAIAAFGNMDVLVNNAGYGAVGIFEKATPEQIQKQFNTNVFGLMNVTRAFLPHFRSLKKVTLTNSDQFGKDAPAPQVVARTIYKAAVSSCSKMRFPSSTQAKLLLTVRKIVPLSWFAAIIRSVVEKGL